MDTEFDEEYDEDLQNDVPTWGKESCQISHYQKEDESSWLYNQQSLSSQLSFDVPFSSDTSAFVFEGESSDSTQGSHQESSEYTSDYTSESESDSSSDEDPSSEVVTISRIVIEFQTRWEKPL